MKLSTFHRARLSQLDDLRKLTKQEISVKSYSEDSSISPSISTIISMSSGEVREELKFPKEKPSSPNHPVQDTDEMKLDKVMEND